MFDTKKQQLVFRCDTCNKIEIFEFEDEKEIEEIKNGTLSFECACQDGMLELLTN